MKTIVLNGTTPIWEINKAVQELVDSKEKAILVIEDINDLFDNAFPRDQDRLFNLLDGQTLSLDENPVIIILEPRS